MIGEELRLVKGLLPLEKIMVILRTGLGNLSLLRVPILELLAVTIWHYMTGEESLGKGLLLFVEMMVKLKIECGSLFLIIN